MSGRGRDNQGRHGEEVALSGALKGMRGTPGGREGPQSSPCLVFPTLQSSGDLVTPTAQIKEERQKFCTSAGSLVMPMLLALRTDLGP